jgi:hypothetical protein
VFVFSLNRKRRDQETHSSGCIETNTLQETIFESPVTPVLIRGACHNYGSLGTNSFLYCYCCCALTILNVILYLTIPKASDKQHWITIQVWVWFMVLNATFNNISVISWLSVLLVDETEEIHRPVASHWQTLSRIEYTSLWTGFELTTSVVIVTDCTGSCKSNYHAITTTTTKFPHYPEKTSNTKHQQNSRLYYTR